VRFSPALLTDLYELTMLQAYFEEQMSDIAVFSLFVRRLPERRNFLLTCGLDEVLGFLETFRFDEAALEYLESLGRFSDRTTFIFRRFWRRRRHGSSRRRKDAKSSTSGCAGCTVLRPACGPRVPSTSPV
jgi:nicotinic acid phosphoribosyltransferase